VTQLEPTAEPSSIDRPNRLTGSAALRLHLTLAAGLILCIGAFCIEVMRALGGNTLSWLYVFEWPFFAGFSIYMWWQLLNGSAGGVSSAKDGAIASRDGAAAPDEEDEALKAWNRYLREMRDAALEEQTCTSDPAESPLKRS
jgi:hypothetical protein